MTQINLHPLERVFVEQVIGGQVGRRDLAAAAGFTRIAENGVRRLSVRSTESDEQRS